LNRGEPLHRHATSRPPHPEQAVKIAAAAHQVCPYSNATRGNIEVALTANGHAADE